MPSPVRALTGALVFAVLLGGLVLQSGGAAASATSTTYAGRVGVNTHLVWVSQADAQATFAAAAAGGVSWVREEFPWGVVEPQPGKYSWGRTDAMMAAASLAGVNVLGILSYSAPWASSDPSGGGDSKYPPRAASDYARYAAAVVSRYGQGGHFWASRPDLPMRPLTAVQIWNEPWGHWFWKPNPSPVAYARLARAAASAIRAVNPNTKILVSGDILQVRTDGAIVDWLRNLRAADPGLNTLVDAYSVHPYPHPRTNGPFLDRSDPRWDYRRVTLTHEIDPSLPIWITEVGWSTANTSDSVSQTTQATYVTDAVVRAVRDWGSYVQRIFLYSFDRDSTNLADREGHYGLLRQDGSAKPAWTALKALLAGSGVAAPSPPFVVATAAPLAGQSVSGEIVWEAVPGGAAVDRVDFLVDGVHRWTERVTPFRFNGDTGLFNVSALPLGTHRLAVAATATDGRVARSEITVQVVKKRRSSTR
jgi:hypothetical protein